MVFAHPWGRYLDVDKARCVVSSWRCPKEVPRAKLTGFYINNALAKTEAISNGFDEAIMLTADGYVADGSGENIFLVTDGKLVTPASYNSILMGITRDTTIKLARNELNLETLERSIEPLLTISAGRRTPILPTRWHWQHTAILSDMRGTDCSTFRKMGSLQGSLTIPAIP